MLACPRSAVVRTSLDSLDSQARRRSLERIREAQANRRRGLDLDRRELSRVEAAGRKSAEYLELRMLNFARVQASLQPPACLQADTILG